MKRLAYLLSGMWLHCGFETFCSMLDRTNYYDDCREVQKEFGNLLVEMDEYVRLQLVGACA